MRVAPQDPGARRDAGEYSSPPLRHQTRVFFAERWTPLFLNHLQLDPALDVAVDILGDGDQRQKLIALVEELGLKDRIRVPGRVSYDELRSTLNRASVFAMPSIAELQSITTMEAMASGLPVVAADAMALPHLVTHGVNGYLYPPRDVDALAARLTDVLSAPAQAKSASGPLV